MGERSALFVGGACCVIGLSGCRKPEAQITEYVNGNLPVVVVDTDGQFIENGDKVRSRFSSHDPPFDDLEDLNRATAEVSGAVGIEIRGNSSQLFPKKQYSLEFWDSEDRPRAESLFGLPSHSQWVLHAPYADKSLIRNLFIYDLSRAIGRYAPHTELVELFLPGKRDEELELDAYRGVYVMTEKISVGPGRLELAPQSSGSESSGGYLLEVTLPSRLKGSDPKFETPEGYTIAVEYPDKDGLTGAQLGWIEDYVCDCEKAMLSGTFDSCLDRGSFIDYFLLSELVRNHDVFTSSTYFTKPREGLLEMGPVWDFDRAIGDVEFDDNWRTDGFLLTERGFAAILLSDRSFVEDYVARWAELRERELSTERLLVRLRERADELGAAADRNFEKWPILGEYIKANKAPYSKTHEEEIEKMATWLSERAAWIDNHMTVEEVLNAARE